MCYSVAGQQLDSPLDTLHSLTQFILLQNITHKYRNYEGNKASSEGNKASSKAV